MIEALLRIENILLGSTNHQKTNIQAQKVEISPRQDFARKECMKQVQAILSCKLMHTITLYAPSTSNQLYEGGSSTNATRRAGPGK